MPRPRTGRVQADIELPPAAPDGHVYVTGKLAAAVVGVTPRMIRHWRMTGRLDDAGQEKGGRQLLLYRLDDVLAAAAPAAVLKAAS